MQVQVEQVFPEPNATVWQAWGTAEDGTLVRFGGDWRPMRDVWVAVDAYRQDLAQPEGSEERENAQPVIAEVPDWAVIGYA